MPNKSTKAKPGKPQATKTDLQKKISVKTVKPERTDVFVSYSHADKKWLTRLEVHLKPLERDHKINIWADTKLRGGDKWRTEIENALAKAKVAILLISADFMASSFIATDELPPLLQASQDQGVLILPVIVGDSGGFAVSNLSKFQALNDPALPLNRMAEGQPDQVFTQLFKRVYEAFNLTGSKTVGKTRSSANAIKPEEAKLLVSKSTVSVVRNKKDPTTKATPPRKINKALLVKNTGEWSAVTVVRSELTDELVLVLKATDAVQKAFLTSLLRQANQLGSLVLNKYTYICRNAEIHSKTEGIQETWHLKVTIQQQNRRAELSFGGVSTNAIAESRIRLLLLNESPPSEQSYNRFYGSSMVMDFDASPLPTLYQQVKKQTTAFNELAPLVAIWYLQVNNLVEHILKLTFGLKGTQLTVRFTGQRNSQYQAELMSAIKVEGVCDLSKSSDEKALLLGPINRY